MTPTESEEKIRMSANDRRRLVRSRVIKDVFLTFRPGFNVIGRLKDISLGGVGFEYTTIDKRDVVDRVEIDIFSQKKDFHLQRLLCKIVYDNKASDYPTFNGIETRRCGLKFEQLSQKQIESLKNAMKLCTQLAFQDGQTSNSNTVPK